MNDGDCDDDIECAGSLVCGENNCSGDTTGYFDCCTEGSTENANSSVNKSSYKKGGRSMSTPCSPSSMNPWNCCSTNNLCGHGEGDCDDDLECKPGHFCGTNNCGDLDSMTSSIRIDCCEAYPTTASGNPTTNPGNYQGILRHIFFCSVCLGGDNCCSLGDPCGEGEGDCDSDSDCFGTLVCGSDNCAPLHGWMEFDPADDCCQELQMMTATATEATGTTGATGATGATGMATTSALGGFRRVKQFTFKFHYE